MLPETAGEPQGTLLVLRVEECGESEGLPVIGRIRAVTLSGAKASRLPHGLSWRENLTNRYAKGKQMTAADIAAQASMTEAGAPLHPEGMWLRSDWQRIQAEVRRLQVRIAKATQEGRWGKVQALQHLLTRSHSGKMLAVKRVTENRGKRTPGVDGKIWSTPAAKSMGAQSLRHRGYRPQPLRRV